MRTTPKIALFAIIACCTVATFLAILARRTSPPIDAPTGKTSIRQTDLSRGSSHSSTHSDSHLNQPELQKIADQYCHTSLLDSASGQEGVLRDAPRYRLIQTHLFFRHGDRTAQSRIEYRPPVSFECGMTDGWLQWRKLKSIKLKPHPPQSTIYNGNMNLFNGFASRPCEKGQLTLIGFKQHLSLGRYIASRYSQLFTNDPNHTYVQSTDYKRTIHSCAAFLLGLLPNDTPFPLSRVPIHVSRGTLLEASPPGIRATYPHCKRLKELLHMEISVRGSRNETAQKRASINRILSIAGATQRIPITEAFDEIWTRLCHQKPLPCGSDGQCIGESLLIEGAQSAHWAFAKKHPFIYSVLAMQPYLQHTVINGIDEALQNIAANKDNYRRLTLSFGHDSNLVSLLSSLGVSQNLWLPYASRLAIELWQDTGRSAKSLSAYFVRLLFNGESLVERLPVKEEHRFAAGRQLIKYSDWKFFVTTGPHRELNSYIRKCNRGY